MFRSAPTIVLCCHDDAVFSYPLFLVLSFYCFSVDVVVVVSEEVALVLVVRQQQHLLVVQFLLRLSKRQLLLPCNLNLPLLKAVVVACCRVLVLRLLKEWRLVPVVL